MIGQEGSYSQLMKSTVNKPPPTKAQIYNNTAPIWKPIVNTTNKIKDALKTAIENVKNTLTPIIFWIVIGFIGFIVLKNNK
jgi:hypothetical protein